jgi:Flp pilus assembly protein TadG
VEFALIVPLICAIVLILVDFGKAMNYWLDLQEVANQGARLAAVKTDFSADSLRTSLKSTELRTGGSTSMPAGAKICVDPGSGQVGDPVTVETTSDYHWVSLPSWIPIGGGGVFTIKGRATMRLERQVLYSAHCSG